MLTTRIRMKNSIVNHDTHIVSCTTRYDAGSASLVRTSARIICVFLRKYFCQNPKFICFFLVKKESNSFDAFYLHKKGQM
jgi:hypothetical protein